MAQKNKYKLVIVLKCRFFLRILGHMEMMVAIQARLAWALLFSGNLEEPAADYSGMLDGMEAAELLALMASVQERLRELEDTPLASKPEPSRLYIDRQYTIRLDAPMGPVLPLRPLLKALFILFLRHPEGIRFKERALFEKELADIYAVILPYTDSETRQKRIRRMMDLADNSFSEKTSVLNARLEELFPETSGHYKIQGYNGHPRRIPLDQLMVIWQ